MKLTGRNSGFSLVEVLCATLILGVALVGLTQGITIALQSSKESELQAAAALLAAGQIETLRAEGGFKDGEQESERGEGVSLYRWKQSITATSIAGLHEVAIVDRECQSGKVIYELRTMLFEAVDVRPRATPQAAKDPNPAKGDRDEHQAGSPGANRDCVLPFGAFTLIEVVISASLMAVILVSSYACLNAALSSRKLIEPRLEVIQNARVALSLMAADLRGACALSKDIDLLGMHRTLGEVQADNLDFGTHNYTPRRPSEGDFCQVSFFLDKDPDGQFILWRRRNPRLAQDPLSGEIAKRSLAVCADCASSITTAWTGTTRGATSKVAAKRKVRGASVSIWTACRTQSGLPSGSIPIPGPGRIRRMLQVQLNRRSCFRLSPA